MPYNSNADLPDQIRDNASESCQTVWREAYNSAEDQYDDEEARVQVAWDAVEDVCSQNDDDVWTRDQEQNAANERLASGAARLTGEDPADAYEARIVPIPEDETTTGLSGTTTNWPRETLKEATERGVWDSVKILKGPGGDGHFELGEQPPVENLAGKVTGSRYEDGVGPVLTAELIDAQLARAVEHQLVSVSPDLSRELGAYDEQLGAAPAERINDVAYITVLDTAASANATIEPATAEALGVHPDDFGENEGGTEQNTPSDGDGAASGDDQHSAVDEPAGSGTGTTGTATSMSDDTSNDELKEQLAAAQEQVDELEAQTEVLEDEVEAKEERIEDLEDENEQYRDEAEFSRRQAAMIAVGGNDAVADTLVDSDRSADDLAEMALDSDHGPEVLGMTDDEPEEEQLSPRERLQEQLASSPSPRGGQGADNDPTDEDNGQPTDEQLAQANDRAIAAMSGNDIMKAQEEQLSGREYLRQHKDVDPVDYTSENALRNAVSNGSGGEH